MKRRTILKGLAAIAPITASGKLLADESNFARGVGSCRLISRLRSSSHPCGLTWLWINPGCR